MAILALGAALSWGGGDFAGGMGVKAAGATARGALRFIVAAHALSLLGLIVTLLLQPAPSWDRTALVWAAVAGVVAGLSLAGFYMALARGAMGSAAAVSGLLAAAIPAGVGFFLDGRPGPGRLLGFALAAAAIWLIAASPAGVETQTGAHLLLAMGGGVGFGAYFTALRFANPLGPLASLAVARLGSIAVCLLWLALLRSQRVENLTVKRGPWLTKPGWLWALTAAVLDSGGNLLYIAATRAGRLDTAAVLASLYPATTILLAAGLLRERPGRQQLAGMALAAVAVVLITR